MIVHSGYCSKTRKDIETHQVRPYYEGSEILEVLCVCPECGQYDFKKFEPDYKTQKDIEDEE